LVWKGGDGEGKRGEAELQILSSEDPVPGRKALGEKEGKWVPVSLPVIVLWRLENVGGSTLGVPTKDAPEEGEKGRDESGEVESVASRGIEALAARDLERKGEFEEDSVAELDAE